MSERLVGGNIVYRRRHGRGHLKSRPHVSHIYVGNALTPLCGSLLDRLAMVDSSGDVHKNLCGKCLTRWDDLYTWGLIVDADD